MPKSCDQNYDEINEIKLTKRQQKYLCSGGGHLFVVLGSAVEPFHVYINIHNSLLAKWTNRMVLQMKRVLVPLHITLSWEHFVTNVTGELPTFALMDL
jgi:hypothetical protein